MKKGRKTKRQNTKNFSDTPGKNKEEERSSLQQENTSSNNDTNNETTVTASTVTEETSVSQTTTEPSSNQITEIKESKTEQEETIKETPAESKPHIEEQTHHNTKDDNIGNIKNDHHQDNAGKNEGVKEISSNPPVQEEKKEILHENESLPSVKQEQKEETKTVREDKNETHHGEVREIPSNPPVQEEKKEVSHENEPLTAAKQEQKEETNTVSEDKKEIHHEKESTHTENKEVITKTENLVKVENLEEPKGSAKSQEAIESTQVDNQPRKDENSESHVKNQSTNEESVDPAVEIVNLTNAKNQPEDVESSNKKVEEHTKESNSNQIAQDKLHTHNDDKNDHVQHPPQEHKQNSNQIHQEHQTPPEVHEEHKHDVHQANDSPKEEIKQENTVHKEEHKPEEIKHQEELAHTNTSEKNENIGPHKDEHHNTDQPESRRNQVTHANIEKSDEQSQNSGTVEKSAIENKDVVVTQHNVEESSIKEQHYKQEEIHPQNKVENNVVPSEQENSTPVAEKNTKIAAETKSAHQNVDHNLSSTNNIESDRSQVKVETTPAEINSKLESENQNITQQPHPLNVEEHKDAYSHKHTDHLEKHVHFSNKVITTSTEAIQQDPPSNKHDHVVLKSSLKEDKKTSKIKSNPLEDQTHFIRSDTAGNSEMAVKVDSTSRPKETVMYACVKTEPEATPTPNAYAQTNTEPTEINMHRGSKASKRLDTDLIEKIDTNRQDPKVKAKIEENDKKSQQNLPTRTSEGFCTKCLIF